MINDSDDKSDEAEIFAALLRHEDVQQELEIVQEETLIEFE